MEDNKTSEETCYQCGKPECEGKDLEWCPTTNTWHDASDKALTEMHGAGSINITDGLGELQEPNYKSAFDAVCARNRELRAELATTRTALTTAEAENKQLLSEDEGWADIWSATAERLKQELAASRREFKCLTTALQEKGGKPTMSIINRALELYEAGFGTSACPSCPSPTCKKEQTNG